MGGRVLVLRPEPGASATARALRAAGDEPVLLPLTRVRPLAAQLDRARSAFDAVAVTSANAVRHAPAELLAPLAGLPLYAVGAATAEAARQAGFGTVERARGDAAALARLVRSRLQAGSRLAYLAGRLRGPDLETTLRAARIEVCVVETYDTVAIRPTAGEIAAAAAGGAVDAVLVHSAEAGRALAAAWTSLTAARLVKGAAHIAISERAAQPVRAAGIGPVFVAGQPTDDAMLAALRTALPAA